LPPLQKIPQHIESDPRELDRIHDSAAVLAKLILSQTKHEEGEVMRAGGQLSVMLRQATGVSKAPYVADFIRLLVDSGEKVLCFLFHREVYDIINSKLEDLKPAMFTGSETPAEKVEARRRFIAGETPVMLMSLRSGAGLDGLQKVCRTVVIGELDWAPAVMEQNIGRVFRDGQTEPVTAYFLVADDGADPLIAEKLGLKRQQAEGIRNPDQEILEDLQVDQGRAIELAKFFLKKRAIPEPVEGQ
jgi:SNF2 family DNA or RNA helicase